VSLPISLLEPADASALFALRRESLREEPLAFLASPEDDLASSEETVRALLSRAPQAVVFGARAPQLVGLVGLHCGGARKAAHKANLWGLYVAPAWRGRGVGMQLVQAAVAHARTLPGVSAVRLGVSESALSARRLYERCGFVPWGIEPDAIRHEGRSLAECHMQLALSTP
jgi:ribosomal protein S18 acetylase RimI-like enzyme